MSFINPIYKRLKKYEEKLNGEVIEEIKEEEKVIPIDDIMKEDKKESMIEIISAPKNAVITSMPRVINLTKENLGILSVKSEQLLSGFGKTM